MEIFQTFECNGKSIQLARYLPEASANPATPGQSVRAPGTGKFEIGAVALSVKKITVGKKIKMTSQIKGKNIAYIYSDLLLYDKDLNQYYGPVVREHIQAEKNKEFHGVRNPDWEDTVNISIKIKPCLRLLTDGVDSTFCFPTPESYGNKDGWLDGLYTSADGSMSCRARITFDGSGQIRKLVAYKEQDRHAMPHDLSLKKDDQFSPFVQIFNQPAEDSQAWQVKTSIATPLTFRGQQFHWTTGSPLPGEYLVGLLVQDMDGNLTRRYAPLTISKKSKWAW